MKRKGAPADLVAGFVVRQTHHERNRLIGTALTAIVLFIATIVPSSVLAQDAPDVLISFTADRSALTVGDLVTLTLEVTHNVDQTAVLPRLQPQWGQFDVRAQTPVETVSNSDGTMTTRQELQVTLFAPGTFETPDFPISVRNPDGTVEQVFPLPVQLTVNSILPGTAEELKDIRSQADLSTPLWEQPLVRALAALLVVAAVAAAAYYFYWRHNKKAILQIPFIDMRAPWEIAIDELDRIERIDLPEDDHFKEHYTLVANAMRVYVQGMYLKEITLVDAIDMTTDEIIAVLKKSSLHYNHLRLVIDLLQESDLVKFAKYAPRVSQAYEESGQARYIVELTMPSFEQTVSQNGAYAATEARV